MILGLQACKAVSEVHKGGATVSCAALHRRLSADPVPAGVSGRKRGLYLIKARLVLERLFGRPSLVWHPEKGEWEGSTRMEHLGVSVDIKVMKVTEKRSGK